MFWFGERDLRPAIVLAAVVLLGALLMPFATGAFAQGASLVRVEKVRTEKLSQTVPVIGRLVSLRSGNVAARIGGPVEQINAEVGDRVTKGQVIAVLDSETLKADLELTMSEQVEAQAEYNTWMAEAELARTDLKRQEGLRKSVAFSQAKFEDAQKRVAVADAKVKRAEANVKIKEAAYARKKIDLEYASVRAPYDGVVIQRFTEEGSFVEKGAAIVKLIGDRALEVEADVPYKRLVGLPIGRVITFRLDDGSKHKATVRAILPSENPLTRTRTVRFSPIFNGTTGQLAESQSVTVSVPVGADRNVVTVHKDAILKRPNGDMVYVVEGDSAKLRPVSLGEAVGSRLEVVSGLKSGDTVVTRGNERLQPGAKIRVGNDAS